MQKLVLSFTFLLLSGCTIWNQEKEQAVNPDPNHTHVDFAIWINGEQVDLSSGEHMAEAEMEMKEDHQHEGGEEEDHHGVQERKRSHLHKGMAGTIHSHHPDATFGDFLKGLEMKFTETCLMLSTGKELCNEKEDVWRMFVNGEEIPYNLDYAFKDLDIILLTYGPGDEDIEHQLEQLTSDACLFSQTCPERGEPPPEDCISDPEVPCMLPLE